MTKKQQAALIADQKKLQDRIDNIRRRTADMSFILDPNLMMK